MAPAFPASPDSASSAAPLRNRIAFAARASSANARGAGVPKGEERHAPVKPASAKPRLQGPEQSLALGLARAGGALQRDPRLQPPPAAVPDSRSRGAPSRDRRQSSRRARGIGCSRIPVRYRQDTPVERGSGWNGGDPGATAFRVDPSLGEAARPRPGTPREVRGNSETRTASTVHRHSGRDCRLGASRQSIRPLESSPSGSVMMSEISTSQEVQNARRR